MGNQGPKGFADPTLPDVKEMIRARDDLGNELAYKDGPWASPAQVLMGHAEAKKQIPMPALGRFGRFWHFDLPAGTLCCDAGNFHYALPLDRAPKDFALHLAAKTWSDAEVLGDLVLLMEQIFRLHSWSDKPRVPDWQYRPETPA